MMRLTIQGLTRTAVLVAALQAASCASVGPASVSRDRFDYNGEVARSWKEQILLNTVKLRYLDMPVFLDVSQIVSGYTVEGVGSVGGTTGSGTGVTIGAQGSYIDRPTITYSPLTGAQFNKNMLTPILPSAILFTMTAGWPADMVFRLAVKSINGIESVGPDSEKYDRLLELMRKLQQSQVVGMRVRPAKQGDAQVVLLFNAANLTSEQEAMREEVHRLLGLAPNQNEFTVVYGDQARSSTEIAMQTRAMLGILQSVGDYVEVPQADILDGRTGPTTPISNVKPGQMRIKYSSNKPSDAIVSVQYRGGWFWVDDRDMDSKYTLALVMLLSTLSETGGRDSLPLVTIPAG